MALMLVTPLVVFYLLIDWHPMLEKVDGWLPREQAGTVRAQLSSVYAKAGVSGRAQFAALFVEDILAEMWVNGGAEGGAAPKLAAAPAID